MSSRGPVESMREAVSAMTNPVVVGIDGSPGSLAAARWAGREAAARHLPVLLLNVWQAPVSNVQFSPDPGALRFWEETQVREAGKQLTDRHPALDVTMRQDTGTPMNVLLDAAATSEMTVLGSRGLGAISGFFQGSVGLHVLASSDQPVVVVRATDTPESPEGQEVVLGLDLDRPCDPLISFAFESAVARRASVRAMHVWDRHKMYGYAAPALDPDLARELRSEQTRLLTGILAPWRGRFPAVAVRESIIDGPVAQRLIEAGRGTDLLTLGRRRRHPPAAGRTGPVAHSVLHHAVCPVAVISHD